MPEMDYDHGFYSSKTLFICASVMAKRIMRIVKQDNLKTLCFMSASSSGSAITTAVMALLHKKIPCQHSYVKRKNWSFMSPTSSPDIVVKNKSHLSDSARSLENNIFILDDCVDSGSTVNAIYQQMKKLNVEHKLNRIILQSLIDTPDYEWMDRVEYYHRG
jgi:hypoxanthine-guanine phosphoribosyltransferase